MLRIGIPQTDAQSFASVDRVQHKEFFRESLDRRGRYDPVAHDTALQSALRADLLRQIFPDADRWPQAQRDQILALLPEHVPSGVDINKNLSEASAMTLRDFYDHVRNNGSWDFKQLDPLYADFGNFHFGLVAKAAGIPEYVARLGASIAQIAAGTSMKPLNLTDLLMDPGFNDDPADQWKISNAFGVYNRISSGDRSWGSLRDDAGTSEDGGSCRVDDMPWDDRSPRCEMPSRDSFDGW